MKPKLELNLIPTTYGGPTFYRPAIRNLEHDIWYWPNISFKTEALAYEWSQKTLNRLIDNHIAPAQKWIDEGWNIRQP